MGLGEGAVFIMVGVRMGDACATGSLNGNDDDDDDGGGVRASLWLPSSMSFIESLLAFDIVSFF